MESSIQNSSFFRLQRRMAVSAHPNLIGLDFIEVEWQKREGNLRVFFVPVAPSQAEKQFIPANLTTANFEIRTITGKTAPFEIRSVTYVNNAPYVQLEIALTATDFAEVSRTFYSLKLLDVESIDSSLTHAEFSFTRILENNPESPTDLPPLLHLPVEINYLAKDYQSFRQLMLDYLTLLLPNWHERHEADLGIVLVDLLAYVADYLSYYQDAVATESYLGTARRRLSLTRHARLLDYRVSEGCNARVWVQIQVTADTVLPIGTPLLTQNEGLPGRILVDEYEQRIEEENNQYKVFETMEEVDLCAQHNEIYFYPFGMSQYSLKRGATKATLIGHFPALLQGDVLIFEEIISPDTGLLEDVNSKHRHVVRLSQQPQLSYDNLYSQQITEIAWNIEDKLPFDLPISGLTADGRYQQNCTVVRGNIVLADSGRTIKGESLSPIPRQGKYRPHLSTRQHLTFRIPFSAKIVKQLSAQKTLEQEPRQAKAAIVLREFGSPWQSLNPQLIGSNNIWIAQRDLLESGPFAREFVVETEEDCQAYLHFGDGQFGKMPNPGQSFKATYRVGNGTEGNTGPETITTIVSDDLKILGVRNPMAAQGGADPESLEEIRLNAPVAFHAQQRCVTEADYATRTEQYPDVLQAIATRQWTGSWNTIFIHVLRKGGRSVDEEFKKQIKTFLQPWAMVDDDIAVVGAKFVPVSIVLKVYIAPHALANQVLQILQLAFSGVTFPDGQQGFFAPANLTFGQPLYLSQIIARALEVKNVVQVEATKFQRWGNLSPTELKTGVIQVSPLEVIQVLNKVGEPENGSIKFKIER